MSNRITGSKLPLARQCAWWAREDSKYPERPQSQDGAAGTALHALHADLVETGEHPPGTPSQEAVMTHLREFWKGRSGTWIAERAYGLSPAAGSARHVGDRIGRAYPEPLSPLEVMLTTDYVGITPDYVTIGDLKTGFGGHVEAPDDNLQLLSAAAAAFLVHRPKIGVVLEILHANEGGVFPRRFVASPLVLYRAMADIAYIQQTVPDAKAKLGDHCKYCPALGACPETGGALEKVVPQPDGNLYALKWTTEFLSEDNDRMMVEALPAIEKMTEAIKDALKLRARERGGIYLSDGKVWKPTVSERAVLDTAKVEMELGSRYPEFLKTISYEQFRRVKA